MSEFVAGRLVGPAAPVLSQGSPMQAAADCVTAELLRARIDEFRWLFYWYVGSHASPASRRRLCAAIKILGGRKDDLLSHCVAVLLVRLKSGPIKGQLSSIAVRTIDYASAAVVSHAAKRRRRARWSVAVAEGARRTGIRSGH